LNDFTNHQGSVVHINIGKWVGFGKMRGHKKTQHPQCLSIMIGTGNARRTNMMASTNAKTFTSITTKKF
jgi:hypothetical protein